MSVDATTGKSHRDVKYSLGSARGFAKAGPNPETLGARGSLLDRILMHRLFGLPIFILCMWVTFEATFTLGAYPMDWIDAGVTWFSDQVATLMPAGLLRDVLVDGIIAGMGGTIIFLPNIVILFLFLTFFEKSGYMARASMMVDRMMKSVGLSGKAFVPLVMGFGCNVPAIMATRSIDCRESRLIAILVSPFMACSARLPVFILFAGAFFDHWAGTMVFLMYMISIGVALLASILLSRTVVSKERVLGEITLPPYRIPSPKVLFSQMWARAVDFMGKVAGVILVGSIIIWFLQTFPQHSPNEAKFESEIAALEQQPANTETKSEIAKLHQQESMDHLQNSYLGEISMAVAPVFEPLGFGWRDTVAIMTGLLAKEVVVASYTVMYAQDVDSDENSQGLREALASSLTPLTAFAFMVFTLLYAPCLATIAVIKRETGSWAWAGFSIGFSLALAWSLAFAIVSIGGMVL